MIDLNSYFASVEQQLQPHLRGKPVGIVPMAGVDSTCCIAASREAKKFGVKTGTGVAEARHRCPGIILLAARHEKYIEMHDKIVRAVGRCIPVHAVKSIDEMTCRLIGAEREEANAVALAGRIQESIYKHAGDYMTGTIGIAPNVLLAKLASDLGKGKGHMVIRGEELPDCLHHIKLQDFSGIGPRMERRFLRFGVSTVEQMMKLSPGHLCQVWGSKVLGWRWWYLLRGHDVPDKPTQRRSVGHSHILPPEKRQPAAARGVLMRLVHKAAARMRKIGYCTRTVVVSLDYLGEQGSWSAAAHLPACQDSPAILEATAHLWHHRPRGNLLKVGVTLVDLEPRQNVTPSLFDQDHKAQAVSEAMDDANRQFGPNSLYLGSAFGHTKDAPMRISFTHIPDEETERADTPRGYGW